MSWWKQGGFDNEMDKPIENKTSAFRFWMPPETEKKVMFLTANPEIFLYEHNFRLGKSWRNWATCLRMLNLPCPMCEAGINCYECAPFTIIDMSEYTDKQGKVHVNEKRLLMAKSATWAKLARQHRKLQEKGKSLQGAVYTIARFTGQKSSSVGDEFDFEEHFAVDEVATAFGVDCSEFDVKDLLKPDKDVVDAYMKQIGAVSNLDTQAKKVQY